MKKYSFVFLVLVLFSCRTKENEFVTAEYAKIEGIWTFNTFTVAQNAPDTLKNLFQSGGFDFHHCQYNAKYVDKNGGYCGGDIELNTVLLSISNNYSYSDKLFVFSLGGDRSKIIYKKGSQIIDGSWDIQINGDKMTGKRVTAGKDYKGEVSFTATRK